MYKLRCYNQGFKTPSGNEKYAFRAVQYSEEYQNVLNDTLLIGGYPPHWKGEEMLLNYRAKFFLQLENKNTTEIRRCALSSFDRYKVEEVLKPLRPLKTSDLYVNDIKNVKRIYPEDHWKEVVDFVHIFSQSDVFGDFIAFDYSRKPFLSEWDLRLCKVKFYPLDFV